MKFAVFLPLATMVFLASVSGLADSPASPDLVRADYEGTLGSNRIQMTLLVQHGKLISPSHYFYQKDRTDIPLSGTTGTTLILIEPSGSTFTLKFKGNGNKEDHSVTLGDRVGLLGTWTGNDGMTYPVALGVLFVGPAPAEPSNCHCPE
ncbi:MAG: hypothetical protein JO076_16810 [Verrucomicrobia bacterium]|nr:hypothetical protein [Verrucomicrobiota bacterium]